MFTSGGNCPRSSIPHLPLLLLLLLLLAPSSGDRVHHGGTHPVLPSGDFGSIGPPDPSSGSSHSTDRPLPSPERRKPMEGDADPHPPSSSTPNRSEFYRPKRTTTTGHRTQQQQSSKPENMENQVSNLKNQLKESQAAQVHTRSIINVLQEKVEAQENDMSIMKNEISHLRREQSSLRELISSLRSAISDSSWAIASVKRGHDQVTDDVHSLKRVQERHNETLLVMEEVIMNSAVDIQNQGKHMSSIQQDLFQLRAQVTEGRDKMDRIQETVGQLEKGHAGNEDENEIEEIDTTITNHLSVNDPKSSSPRTAQLSGGKAALVEAGQTNVGGLGAPPPAAVMTKLWEHEAALELTRGVLGNLTDQMTSVESQLSVMSQRQMMDTQLLQVQQSFINFTSQLYQLQQWRQAQTEKGRHTEEYMSQHENDLTSVIFHLESQTEKLHLLEGLITEYQTTDRPSLLALNQSVAELNHSMSRILAERNQSETIETDRAMEGRVKVVEDGFHRMDGKLKEVEIMVLNISLTQCKAVNEQLMDDVRGGNYVKQISDVQMKISEQTTALARLDRGLAGIFQELDKNTGTASALSDQLDELKKLSPDVATLQRELLNFVMQLPSDCYDIPATTGSPVHDGVYLIRPETSRQSARTFCLIDEGVVWTVIQRRSDGRESFARSWDDYRSGFGDAASEFWLGNENIHRLTDGSHVYRLRIDLWDVLGRYWSADYASFRIHSEDALYRLELGDFRGNATDALRYSNLMPFSALDRDNDVSTTHCAQFYQSGWWYKHCHYSNLNGRYTAGIVWFHQDLDEWIQLRQTTMRISMVTGADRVTKRPSG